MKYLCLEVANVQFHMDFPVAKAVGHYLLSDLSFMFTFSGLPSTKSIPPLLKRVNPRHKCSFTRISD
jgi:hypothetical protein